MLESVQIFACRVCLKQWNLDYDNMLQMLDIPPLSNRRKYLQLTTMYCVSNNYFFLLVSFIDPFPHTIVVRISVLTLFHPLFALRIYIHALSLVYRLLECGTPHLSSLKNYLLFLHLNDQQVPFFFNIVPLSLSSKAHVSYQLSAIHVALCVYLHANIKKWRIVYIYNIPTRICWT